VGDWSGQNALFDQVALLDPERTAKFMLSALGSLTLQ
jgi:hypothetical protein